MSIKEEKISSVPNIEEFDNAARILSSLMIEDISLSLESLRLVLKESFPNLSEDQINELVKTFSKNGGNINERVS